MTLRSFAAPWSNSMTNLSPLSQAAQAVRDAALATYDKSIPKDDSLWALDRASVVAALCAAAVYCRRDALLLLSVAAELEGS